MRTYQNQLGGEREIKVQIKGGATYTLYRASTSPNESAEWRCREIDLGRGYRHSRDAKAKLEAICK